MSIPRKHDPESVPAEVTAGLYDELRRIAHRAFAGERSDHTLQPTAAVNEACLRLMTTSRLPDAPAAERLALAARVLRQVLIDHHRQKDALKRGGGLLRVDLDPERPAAESTMVEFGSMQAALESLRVLHERQAPSTHRAQMLLCVIAADRSRSCNRERAGDTTMHGLEVLKQPRSLFELLKETYNDWSEDKVSRLAAALAYIMLNQQDLVGLVTFGEGIRRQIPPRSSPGHLRAVIDALEHSEPAGDTALGRTLHQIAGTRR